MTNHANDLDEILEEKVTACDDFLSATLLLKAALESEEMTAVDRLLGRRQELIGVIDGVDRRIGQCRHAIPPEQKRRIRLLSEDLKRILQQIMSANGACDAIASSRCEGLRNEMIGINRKEEGLQGYARGAQRTPKFLNIRT